MPRRSRDCIEDGIEILRPRPLWQYVPDLDFDLVREDLGPSPPYDHLGAIRQSARTDPRRGILISESVCRVLGLKAKEVLPDVPLTSYGLDFLSAPSLSHAFEPVLVISRIQLLATMALRDLESHTDVSDSSSSGAAPSTTDFGVRHGAAARRIRSIHCASTLPSSRKPWDRCTLRAPNGMPSSL